MRPRRGRDLAQRGALLAATRPAHAHANAPGPKWYDRSLEWPVDAAGPWAAQLRHSQQEDGMCAPPAAAVASTLQGATEAAAVAVATAAPDPEATHRHQRKVQPLPPMHLLLLHLRLLPLTTEAGSRLVCATEMMSHKGNMKMCRNIPCSLPAYLLLSSYFHFASSSKRDALQFVLFFFVVFHG